MSPLLLWLLQGDLSDEDVMILDNGEMVFMWFGRDASEMVKKLSVKSAQVLVRIIMFIFKRHALCADTCTEPQWFG
jgi:hypothetical protein